MYNVFSTFSTNVVHWNRDLPLALMSPPLSIESFDLCSWLAVLNRESLSTEHSKTRGGKAAPASADARQRTHARTPLQPQSEEKQLVTDTQLNTHI